MPVIEWAPSWLKTEVPDGKKNISQSAEEAAFNAHCDWYEKNLRIKDKHTGVMIPFKLHKIQRQLEWLVFQADRQKRMLLLNVLKARREGLSTWVSAMFFRRARTNPNRTTLSMSCDQQSTDFIHDMTRDFARSIKGLKLAVDSNTEVKFEDNGSQFFLYTAGSRDRTGRGFAASQLHFTEFDFAASEEYYNSVMQVPPTDWPTIVVVESTAKGAEGPMQKHRDSAVRGENGFVPVFFAWFDFPEYRMDLSWDELLTRPQTGPMELSQARQWIEDNRKKVETIRDRILTLRKEKCDALGTSVVTGLYEGSGAKRTGRSVRVASTSGGKAEKTAGAGGGEAKVPKDRPGQVSGAWTGDGRGLPGGSEERSGDLWNDLRRKSSLRGRALLDPVRREWETTVCLGIAGDDWRERTGRMIADIEKLGAYQKWDAHDILEKAAIIGLTVDSLSDYERELIDEFDLELEQILQLRRFKAERCSSSEVVRRHEYPSRPEESFEYPEESVLDPATIRAWTDKAKKEHPKKVRMKLKEDRFGEVEAFYESDPLGAILLWEDAEDGVEYAMGVDPSSGLAKGDWCVACVIRKDSGLQVAEFRSRMIPDRAIDQIEALGVYYNKAFTGVEINSIGLAFCRSFEDRGTLPMYERENPRRKEPGQLTHLIGWASTGGQGGTRDMLITNARQTVMEGWCRIRSLETLAECKSLVVNRSETTRNERIEAKRGSHDDGFFAWGISLIMRNRLLQIESEVDEEETPEVEYPEVVERLIEASTHKIGKPRIALKRAPLKVIGPGKRTLDGNRRNLL